MIKKIKEFLAFKKAQLGFIEFKYMMIGVLVGVILGLVVAYLANHGMWIPFKLSFLCPVPVK